MVSSFIDQSFYFEEGQWMCAGGEGKFKKGGIILIPIFGTMLNRLEIDFPERFRYVEVCNNHEFQA
jgi:hypothetical protein